ncbi:MAG: hypothetical protein FWE74_08850 [Oscillospiraceae bacterium]|nr:hypothetical protein [Oscillospiraceae bacterium]
MKRKLSMILIAILALSLTQLLAGAALQDEGAAGFIQQEKGNDFNGIIQFGEGEGSVVIFYLSEWVEENMTEEEMSEQITAIIEVIDTVVFDCGTKKHEINCCYEAVATEEEIAEYVDLLNKYLNNPEINSNFDPCTIPANPALSFRRCVGHHSVQLASGIWACRYQDVNTYICSKHIACLVTQIIATGTAVWNH